MVADDDAADAGLNERLGAGAGAAMMGAGLEGDKGGGAADIVAAARRLASAQRFRRGRGWRRGGRLHRGRAEFGAGRGENAADGGVWAG